MADQYAAGAKKSWGSAILDSFVGALIGLLLFLLAFAVLWNNEGTVDFSRIARTSVDVPAGKIDPSASGKLVSLSGKLTSSDLVGDSQFLKPGNYIQLSRRVEMYAWAEKSKNAAQDKLGGGSENKTTYNYEKAWTASPKAASQFKYPAGHENPALLVESMTFTALTAKIGVYGVDPQAMELPKPRQLTLTPDKLLPGSRLEGGYIFNGKGSLTAPQLGDIRISYGVVENNLSVTAFGQLEDDHLVPFLYKGKNRLYRALKGSRDEAIAAIAAEHPATVWVVRIVGFLMMWGGLFLVLGPLNAWLKVFPWLGTAGRWLSSAVTFPIALVLSAVTVIIAIIAHNLWLLLVVIAALAGGVYWAATRQKK